MASIEKDMILRSGKIIVYQDVVVQEEKVSPAGVITDLGMAPVTKASSGVVVNVADDLFEFEIGDRLIFSPYCGFALNYKGDGRYLLLADHEIFGHYKGEVGDVEVR